MKTWQVIKGDEVEGSEQNEESTLGGEKVSRSPRSHFTHSQSFCTSTHVLSAFIAVFIIKVLLVLTSSKYYTSCRFGSCSPARNCSISQQYAAVSPSNGELIDYTDCRSARVNQQFTWLREPVSSITNGIGGPYLALRNVVRQYLDWMYGWMGDHQSQMDITLDANYNKVS